MKGHPLRVHGVLCVCVLADYFYFLVGNINWMGLVAYLIGTDRALPAIDGGYESLKHLTNSYCEFCVVVFLDFQACILNPLSFCV